MRSRTILLVGVVTAAASSLALGFVPEGAPFLLFVSLLGIFFGLCLTGGGAWIIYTERRAAPPAPVPWRSLAACVAAALLVALLISPWMGRAIIPTGGIGVAAVVGAVSMQISARHVGHSLLTGLLSACAFVLAAGGTWFLGAA